MTCPFCAEDDFDMPGLKSHLASGDCEPYNRTQVLTRRFSTTLATDVRAAARRPQPFVQHARTCPAYGNYQPPYEDCDCGADKANGN